MKSSFAELELVFARFVKPQSQQALERHYRELDRDYKIPEAAGRTHALSPASCEFVATMLVPSTRCTCPRRVPERIAPDSRE